ncbi:hypothetical protein [Streptomyces sp. MUM 178J]|uniref:hypothetical protein n=1 Tax=Streptomyces sp. MUM 178J TaxID=2791991 RepID=UPI002E7C3CBA|nr:hypothetical protein [Streptomyces sp. MUM 178J]WRQ79116.1 hypothetical protein I3F59_006850 [Streptomyces sp. MUM 178J]
MFAAACVLLTALGHMLMSATPVPWPAMLGAFAAVGCSAWALGGRERGFAAVTAAAVVTQAALHSLFSLAQAAARSAVGEGGSFLHQWGRYLLCGMPGGPGAPEGASATATAVTAVTGGAHGHAHHTLPHTPGHGHLTAADTGMGMGHDMGGMSAGGMLTAHLLAALLCGLWLAHGEQAVFRILRCFTAWITAPLRVPLQLPAPAHRPRVRARRTRAVRGPRRLPLVHAITSRGPPVGSAVL